MSAQHTPGPWTVHNGCNVFADAAHVPLTNAAYIACTGGLSGIDTIERDAANARLIAAAPDFYDVACALELLLRKREDELGQLSPEMEVIAASNRAALAKARGQS